MTWPGIDYHNHTCGTTLDAMLDSAVAHGVREFGISEHIFMLDEGRWIFPDLEEEGRRCSRAEYVDSIAAASGERTDIVLRLALEVDFVPGTESAVSEVLAGVDWDYLIGSVHVIDGIDLFLYTPSSVDEGERLWVRYYELIAEAIESGTFDIISHPVRNAELNPHLPPRFDALLEEIAAFARLHGVALELNGYDTRTWPELVDRLTRACGKTGCPVSLGSDAHAPSQVSGGMVRATELAIANGVPGVVSIAKRERQIVPL